MTRGGTASRIHRGGQAQRVARSWAAAMVQDGAPCARCGQAIDLDLSGLDPRGLTVGHRVAVVKGGADTRDNIQPEHRACNLAGAARPVAPRATLATPPPRETP